MDEFSFVDKYVSLLNQDHGILVGPGDDCAVIQQDHGQLLLYAVDQVIADVHYATATTSPCQIAQKLLKRNLSDIAAMGGMPTQAVLTMALAEKQRDAKNDQWFKSFFEGLELEAAKWCMSVCGGDVGRMPGSCDVFTLSILGHVKKEKLCLRSGAKQGDLIVCTGYLGNSFPSDHHLSFIPRLKEAEFLAGTYTNAMIDISDGLLKDLKHILDQSMLGANLSPAKFELRQGASISNALSDGEDYELLIAVAESKIEQLISQWPFADVPISVIGQFTNEHSGIFNLDENVFFNMENLGYDHLS